MDISKEISDDKQQQRAHERAMSIFALLRALRSLPDQSLRRNQFWTASRSEDWHAHRHYR